MQNKDLWARGKTSAETKYIDRFAKNARDKIRVSNCLKTCIRRD